MEIAPIPGIRGLPMVRARETEMRAPAILDIDPSSKANDGEEQRNGKKAAGAEENEEDELLVEGEELEQAPNRQIDYFA